MSQFININVVQINVRDWEKAKKFYADVLEWPVVFSSDEFGWHEFGVDNASHIALNHWKSADPLPSSGTIVVFSVENAHATAKNLRERGVKVDEVIDIPGMVSYGTFYDPEGNSLQFASNLAG
ncbi:MAG: VOC family protein [Anaerolineae bacterium]|nr:VOC family protein [Anaerolineae bacterium]